MNFGRNFPVLLVIVIAAVFLSAGCTDSKSPSAEVTVPSTVTIPELVGTWAWNGEDLDGHSLKNGFDSTASSWVLNVTEQDGRSFAGYKEIVYNGTTKYENFSGVVSYDGTKLYLTDHDEGFNIVDVISPDEIELIYLDDGDNARVTIVPLVRR